MSIEDQSQPHMPDAMFPKSVGFILRTYLVKSPWGNVWKGMAYWNKKMKSLKGDWTNLQSFTFKTVQSDFRTAS